MLFLRHRLWGQVELIRCVSGSIGRNKSCAGNLSIEERRRVTTYEGVHFLIEALNPQLLWISLCIYTHSLALPVRRDVRTGFSAEAVPSSITPFVGLTAFGWLSGEAFPEVFLRMGRKR